MYNYMATMYGLNKNPERVIFYVQFFSWYSTAGMIITPLLGLIMDKVGYANFLLLESLCIFAWVPLVNTHLYSIQFACLVIGNLVNLSWSTFANRWVVYFIPPALIGTGNGVINCILGGVIAGVDTGTPFLMTWIFGEESLLQFRLPFLVWGPLAVAAGIALYIRLHFVAVPTVPPQPRRKCCLCCAGWGEEQVIEPFLIQQEEDDRDFSARVGIQSS